MNQYSVDVRFLRNELDLNQILWMSFSDHALGVESPNPAVSCTDVDMSGVPLISIIDDDSLAREGICELVDSLGYKGVTFESAEHFFQSGVVADTTCLITDVQMPGLNGLELQEALRSQGYQTPVIVITAYSNEKNRARALANGAVGFLSKPFNEQCLIECLNTAIDLRSSQARGHVAAHHPKITSAKAGSR